jgi:pilus assembly protein Flp/PilA
MKPDTVRAERGQGLVEYALILVLVAVVVIVILALLGPAIGQVFSSILADLQPRGVIASVSADRTGGGAGNDVVVTITVSADTTVDVSDSQNAAPLTNVPCNGSCQVTLIGVGFNGGTVTVTATAGGTATATYPPKS